VRTHGVHSPERNASLEEASITTGLLIGIFLGDNNTRVITRRASLIKELPRRHVIGDAGNVYSDFLAYSRIFPPQFISIMASETPVQVPLNTVTAPTQDTPNKVKKRAELKRKTDRRELTPFQRGIIVNLHRYGASQNQLGKDFEISQASVSQLVKRTDQRQTETGLSYHDEKLYTTQEGRGRHKALSDEQKEALVAWVNQDDEHRKMNSRQITVSLPFDFLGCTVPAVSASTVEKTLYGQSICFVNSFGS